MKLKKQVFDRKLSNLTCKYFNAFIMARYKPFSRSFYIVTAEFSTFFSVTLISAGNCDYYGKTLLNSGQDGHRNSLTSNSIWP